MVSKTYPVRWDTQAKDSLQEIITYLKQGSPTTAQKVKQTLLQLAASLKQQPERFPAEPYLTVKAGNYRSVSKWRYKIIYRVTADAVYILDVFHTSRDPFSMEELTED